MYIYNRYLSVNMQKASENNVIVNGVFLDSYHEMCLTLEVDMTDFSIAKAAGELRRIPHPDCKDTENRIAQLVGLKLQHGVRRQIQAAVGGQSGCTHLVDLALECVKALVQAKYSLMTETLTKDEIRAESEAFLKGSCYHYREGRE